MRFVAPPIATIIKQTLNLAAHKTKSKPSSANFCFFSSVQLNPYSLLNKSPSNLCQLRISHALLLIGGFLNSNASHLCSRLVQLYVQLGSIHEALILFNRLKRTHTIACNSILRGYVKSSQFSEAIQFFNQLTLRPNFVPDNYTCPLVLKACSGLCALDEGRKVRDYIRFTEFRNLLNPNVFTSCALIDMFAKCGSLDEARQVFDEMPQRDLATWTAVICGTIREGECVDALVLFERMRREGMHIDAPVMAAVLPACGKLEARRTGIALQGCVMKSGLDSDLFVSNALMDMYCKLGGTCRAYNVFREMICRDDVSWSTLISGYLQNGEYSRSLDLYLEMINSGVKINAVAVGSIVSVFGNVNESEHGKMMHGCVIKQGFEFDGIVVSALIDMYSKCFLMGEAEMIFNLWSEWDIMTWNSMISGYACNENLDLALGLFRKIWDSEFKPNPITLGIILSICTRIGALKQGMEAHCYAIRNSVKLTVSLGNSIVDMYCKCGRLELGVKFFDHMVEKDVISYNTIISAYGFHGYGKKALILFDEMKSHGIKPSKVTFVGLLSACSHSGLVEEGWSLYNSMTKYYGIEPNMEHYSCMVDLLGRSGRISDACNFIRMMPEGADCNVLGCLLAACCVQNKVVVPADLVEEIFHDKLEDSGSHILLSNMYSSIERWNDASRMRALIKEKGLRKKPGNSWIQIGYCTHVFDARDTMHPDFTKIQELLENLFVEMRKEWCVMDPCISPSLI